MNKYKTLLNILTQIRKEAPSNYKRYYPLENDTEGINAANSKAYIHLFLKVKFGLLTFKEREEFVSDGTNDGGIDGYYIDEELKKVYFIQSKFRTNEANFEGKDIKIEEILKMDLDRITKGETTYEDGTKYSGKIQGLIRKIQEIDDYPKYKEEVVLLANLKKTILSKLKPITLFPTEIYDFERCYNELVFPVISGTFYNPSELKITINVSNYGGSNKIDYYVNTEIGESNIAILFVPTKEIGRILNKFKNSILKFNPRSFLELSSGSVNSNIKKSITDFKTNEFALFNNGITMLSDNTFYKDRIGKRNEAELIITNPQIINGGQTAFTLSRIYEDLLKNSDNLEDFENKEVLLKVITFNEEFTSGSEADKLNLIEQISKATNNQTQVTEADRRSNEKVQIELQENIYNEFGYFYERKKGEFGDGIRSKYIDRSQLIDREVFLRVCLTINGSTAQSRRGSQKQIFKKETFSEILKDPSLYKKYFYGYVVLQNMNRIQKQFDKDENNKFGVAQYANGLRYGKMAVINVVSDSFKKNYKSLEEFNNLAEVEALKILNQWAGFESYIKGKKANNKYFREVIDPETGITSLEVNFDNYYKGRTINTDLNSFFRNK